MSARPYIILTPDQRRRAIAARSEMDAIHDRIARAAAAVDIHRAPHRDGKLVMRLLRETDPWLFESLEAN